MDIKRFCLKNHRKIIKLAFRLFFYIYFAAWSLSFFPNYPDASYNLSRGDKEVYLLTPQLNSSLASVNFETKRLKNLEEYGIRFFYSGKFLSSSLPHLLKLTRSYHFIETYELPAILSAHSLIDYPRSPPHLT